MSYQEKRSLVFLSLNTLATLVYVLVVMGLSGLFAGGTGPALSWWAVAILVYVPVQIVLRVAVMIVFAASIAATGSQDNVELEDELDKLIDLKASRICGIISLPVIGAGLFCLVFGGPALALVWSIGLAMVAGGLAGDLASLLMYRRGV